MGKIKGRIVCEFEYNESTGSMVCGSGVQSDNGHVPLDVALRAYTALGAKIHEINQYTRYGIRNEEDHQRVVEEIQQELDREL